MYTEREKVRFVERMWAEGLRPAAAKRRWGHPSRASLGKWEKQALAGELPAERPVHPGECREREKYQRFPEETKREFVRLVTVGGKSRSEAGLILGVPRGTYSSWIYGYKSGTLFPEQRAQGAPKAKGGPRNMGKKKNGERQPRPEAEKGLPQAREGRLKGIVVPGGPMPPYVRPTDPRGIAAEEENLLLRAVLADLKAAGSDPRSTSNRRKAEFGERLRRETGLPLRAITAFLRISKSSYEYQRARLGAPARDDELAPVVAEIFEEEDGRYGYRRIWAALRERGIRVSEKVVRRIMAASGLAAKRSQAARKWSSYAGEITDAPENLLLDVRGRHAFKSFAPNRLWFTDVTEFKIGSGKLYLSALVDAFDGRVVARTVSKSPDAEMANSMLRDAVASLGPGEHPVIHSDRGCHYRWPAWIAICERAELLRSMSRKGHSPDNAAMEGFFGRMKVEMFHDVDWSFTSLEDLRAEIEGYVVYYNERRLKSFREDGKLVYDTIAGRRKRLGLAA